MTTPSTATPSVVGLAPAEIWFVTGSQHLYGPDTLETVAADSAEIAAALDAATGIPARIVV